MIEGNEKFCPCCKQKKSIRDFYTNKSCSDGLQGWCKKCHTMKNTEAARRPNQKRDARLKQWREENREKIKLQIKHNALKRKYGVSLKDYNDMIKKQNGKCVICFSVLVGRTAHLDHCHATGTVRAVLCESCNKGLGNFRDNPASLRSAASYLERFAAMLPDPSRLEAVCPKCHEAEHNQEARNDR